MKLITILICVQAVLMLATISGTGYMMYSINSETTSKNGAAVFAAHSFIFYVIMALHGTSLVIHGLSTLWCRKTT